MKRFFILAIFFAAATHTSFSQSLGYQDLGLLFSENDNNGTSRANAMGGAFGALGGDISSININPAGLSVFSNSLFTATLNSRSSDINTNYYGNSTSNQDQFLNFSQAGAVLVFDTYTGSDWSKFAMGFNYRITKDFNDSFFAEGNSGVATFINFPYDENNPQIEYNIADEQAFNNKYLGKQSELNIGFSAIHQKKLHLGIALNFYDIDFGQKSTLSEFNSDNNGNELDAFVYQENFTTGTGFSANTGFIYKAHPNFRFGLSYQTPTWYTEIIEESNIVDNDGYIGDTEIVVSNNSTIYRNTDIGGFPSLQAIYKLKTPSKLTASAAFIFGKKGLLSIDYYTKNYKGIKLSGDNFSVENQNFKDHYRNTHNLNIGSEWRFNRFSLRGGYAYQQSPDKEAIDSDNLKAYSFGGGYDFGNFKLDFSYTTNNKTAAYNFYSGFDVNAADIALNNRVFTATVSLHL